MIEEQRHSNPTMTDQRMVPLNYSQRRRLLVHAIGWIGFGGILVSFSCLYGPLAIDWLLPATPGLLVALVVGIVVALVDIAEVCIFLFGLALLQEALFGSAIQTIETSIEHNHSCPLLVPSAVCRLADYALRRLNCLSWCAPANATTLPTAHAHAYCGHAA